MHAPNTYFAYHKGIKQFDEDYQLLGDSICLYKLSVMGNNRNAFTDGYRMRAMEHGIIDGKILNRQPKDVKLTMKGGGTIWISKPS